MKELTVIDLFAGIGGFSYGLHNASSKFKTIAFAEIDQFCNKVLKKNFGNVKIYEDVRDVRIKQPVFLVCGGFPCQGFSVAGLQRGTKDNRYLWPEMFNVIKHTKPRWVIAENVRGIVNVEDGMAFKKVYTDLESEGYEVQAFNIPAAAKGAWHRRERIWFVACNPDVVYPYDFRCEQHTEAEEKGKGRAEAAPMPGSSYVPDSKDKRREQTQWQRGESSGRGSNDTRGFERKRKNFESDVPDSNSSGHENRHQNERPTKRESEEGGMLKSEGICPSESDVSNSNKCGSGQRKNAGNIGNEGRTTSEVGGESLQSEDRKTCSDDSGQSNEDVSNSSVKRPRQGKDRCLEEKIGEEERGGNKPPLRTETRSADVSDSESIGHGGGNSKECGNEQWKFQQKEQKRNEMGSETEGCGELSGGERNVSDSEVEGLEGHDEHHSSVSGKDKKSHTGNESGGTKIDVWNTSGTGFKSRTNGQGQEQNGGASPPGEQCQGDWSEIIAQFRGIPNGVSSELDKTRTNRLKSLGNSIVPQIAEEIGRAIIKAEIKNGG